MTNSRLAMPVVAAIYCMTAASPGPVFAAGTPSDFRVGDEFGIVPSAAPMPRLPAADDQKSIEATQGNPLWGMPIDALHATRERPVFSPSRRPPAPAVVSMPAAPVKVVAPAATAASALSLLGIVVGKDEAFAVFINTQTHDTVRLKTGEGEDGWVLRSITGREATIEKANRTETLKLPPTAGVPK